MKKQHLSGASIFLVSSIGVNFLGFAFNAYLGRALSFEDFALITLFNSFSYLLSVFQNALAVTMNHRTSSLVGQYGVHTGLEFLYATRRRIILFSIALTALWLALLPVVGSFFHVGIVLPLLFTPIVLISFVQYANGGFLQGAFHFKQISAMNVLEALSKLVFAWILLQGHAGSFAYISIPLSVVVAFIISLILIPKPSEPLDRTKTYAFPRKFFTGSVIAGFASMAYLTFDVMLAKHFLLPREAGQYALLSLIGKMIYFFALLPNLFTVAIVSRSSKSTQNKIFLLVFGATAVLLIGAFAGLSLFGSVVLPILFGAKATSILQYLIPYAGAISLFALSSCITTFHLALQEYAYPITSIVMACGMCLGLLFFHANIDQFIHVILYTGLASLVVSGGLHVLESNHLLTIRKGLR